MADKALVDYVKQNFATGFSEMEIRDVLRDVGWHESEIEEGFLEAKSFARPAPIPEATAEPPETNLGFFTRHKKGLLTVLIILVAAPILAFSAIALYQNYIKTEEPPAEILPPPTPQQTTEEVEMQTKTQRDRQRLQDITAIQTGLSEYFAVNNVFPKNLQNLITATTTLESKDALTSIPRDPKTDTEYLYNALGNPALHYSLAFVLEGDTGTLKAGLNVVSEEKKVNAEDTTREDQLVKGETALPEISSQMTITDLSKLPFYPGEEITLEVKTSLDLDAVLLVTDSLNLTDRKKPFSFTFSAPKTPGEYQVKIFGFTGEGQSFYQTTRFVVTPSRG